MRVRTKVLAVSLLVVAAVVILIWPSGRMASRDLGCGDVVDDRAARICRTIAQSMQWTWFGHAIVSPGWRLTWDGLRRVHCAERIGSDDRTALERLATARDWRLQSAAENLVRLLNVQERRASEPESSIFNPASDSYILRSGCAAAK